jgi:membrane-associated phospholipid phosphatase
VPARTICHAGLASGPTGPLVAWPGWRHLLYAWTLSLANGVWFSLVYAGCDLLTALHTLRIPVHFAAELEIPFVPAMTLFYMSIYLLFLAGPFILRTRSGFKAVIITQAIMIGIAGICFLLVPAQLAFPPPREEDLDHWAGVFRLADRLNLTYNLLPSLHVALTVSCVTAFASHAGKTGKILLWIWAISIAISTVLIHQHHVLDALAGWALASACMKLVYDRLSRSQRIPNQAAFRGSP